MRRSKWIVVLSGFTFASLTRAEFLPPQVDMDTNGYLDRCDANAAISCLGGPDQERSPMCRDRADFDHDTDTDLHDAAGLQNAMGHLPIPLLDREGNPIGPGDTRPYNARQTCGGCHDLDTVTNGFLFQQGRTDFDGNFIMKENYWNDGRWWTQSPARYGTWGQSFQKILALKNNTNPSHMDQTTFAWIRDCGGCHAGGGAGEFDRDEQVLYDDETGEFGYQALGLSPEDVALDGDYSVLSYSTGAVSPARWDITGLSGPECMLCHRDHRTVVNGVDMHNTWRAQTLSTGTALVDAGGQPVRAFESSGTAGQGWFSLLNVAPGTTPRLQIDYAVGLANNSLEMMDSGALALDPDHVARPRDRACMSCHPYATITGTRWFDTRDIHFSKFNNLSDEDPTNDVPAEQSRVCSYCHPGDLHHEFAKGGSPQVKYRNDRDYVNFRTCRDCHLTWSPVRHPDAPQVPGDVAAHLVPPFDILSCQACHVPYALATALLFRDITIPGMTGSTAQYLSADPLNPADADKSKWHPTLIPKRDSDGVTRWFPANLWINIYFADWDQNGTPADLSDDLVTPIYTWRVQQIIGPTPLPVVTDDNGDGQPEINRKPEILAYLQALKANDTHGTPGAIRPVLVKGPRVWYEDPEAPGGVSSFNHLGSGIPMTSYPYIWEMDHNVLAKEESWGAGDMNEGCQDCHSAKSPVFDRLVLIDPFDEDGKPVYEKVRTLTGLNPP